MKPLLGRRLDVAQAAALLGMTEGQIRSLVRRDQIVYHRVTGPQRTGRAGRPQGSSNTFFFELELVRWVDATRQGPDVAA